MFDAGLKINVEDDRTLHWDDWLGFLKQCQDIKFLI